MEGTDPAPKCGECAIDDSAAIPKFGITVKPRYTATHVGLTTNQNASTERFLPLGPASVFAVDQSSFSLKDRILHNNHLSDSYCSIGAS